VYVRPFIGVIALVLVTGCVVAKRPAVIPPAGEPAALVGSAA